MENKLPPWFIPFIALMVLTVKQVHVWRYRYHVR